MDQLTPLLTTRGLGIGYGAPLKACTIAGPLDLAIHAGKLICLLGPNGSGKSTLLRTLAGLQSPLEGEIRIAGDSSMDPRRLARLISLVLTDPVRNSNLTVHALVALGRYPYSGWLGVLDDTDRSIVGKALGQTGMSDYAERKVSTLSDGESQKVMLARALAQDTPLMMLDEPTAHLDLPSRIQLMQLLHLLARETGKGILVSTHELDLALQVADEVWLLQKGGRLDTGIPEALVLNGTFETVFDKSGVLFDKASGTFNIHTGNHIPVRFTGDGIAAFWTKKALRRLGYTTGADQAASLSIHVSEDGGHTRWTIESNDTTQHHASLEALLQQLKH